MPENPGKWSVGQELAVELKAARKRANKTIRDVAAAKLGSRQKLWRLEKGIGPYKYADVKALCEFYGVPPAQSELLGDMARASDDTTFTERYAASSPPKFGLYRLMEVRSRNLTVINEELVNGLLQTEDYHRALLDVWDLTGKEANAQQIELRQVRQANFWGRAEGGLSVVMQEATLHHVIGGPEVMSEQVTRLKQYADRDRVSIRYIPLHTGPHLAMNGPFTIITSQHGDAIYTEQLDGGRMISDPNPVELFRRAATMAVELSRDIREFQ